MTAAAVLLADSDAGKGSPIGLLVVLLLVIAVYFLWRSMNRHLKKVQTPLEQRAEPNESGSAPMNTTELNDPDKIENRPES